MYMFVIEILQNSKYHYLAPPWHTLGQSMSPNICNFFFRYCRVQTENGKYLLIYDLSPPPPPLSKTLHSPFPFKCSTALWMGKENVIWTREPFGQSLSKITAVSGNVDQLKLDFDSPIDPYILCILIKYIHSRRQHKC